MENTDTLVQETKTEVQQNSEPVKEAPLVFRDKKPEDAVPSGIDPTKKEVVNTENTDSNNHEEVIQEQVIEEEQEDEEFIVTPEDLGSFLADETEGVIKNVNQLHEILQTNAQLQERIKELEANPMSLLKDPRQASIAKFLMDYKGDDFSTGIQTYARLQSLNIAEMKSEDVLREAYVMDKAQQGISRTDAEDMFSIEFDRKYSEYGDKAEKFINAEAFDARKKLEAAKLAYTVEETKDDDSSVQQEREYQEARDRYVQSTEQAFNNDKGEFTSIILEGLTDNPEHDFTFELENPGEIKDLMLDYQKGFNERYGLSGGGFNAELMKNDLAIARNFEKISQELFKHGETIGYERAIMERQNIKKKDDVVVSNSGGQGAVANSWKDVKFIFKDKP